MTHGLYLIAWLAAMLGATSLITVLAILAGVTPWLAITTALVLAGGTGAAAAALTDDPP